MAKKRLLKRLVVDIYEEFLEEEIPGKELVDDDIESTEKKKSWEIEVTPEVGERLQKLYKELNGGTGKKSFVAPKDKNQLEHCNS